MSGQGYYGCHTASGYTSKTEGAQPVQQDCLLIYNSLDMCFMHQTLESCLPAQSWLPHSPKRKAHSSQISQGRR